MKSIGVWLIIFAVGSALLPYFNLQFILLAWIDMWGPTVGWIIRITMLTLGVALIAIAAGKAARTAVPPSNQAP